MRGMLITAVFAFALSAGPAQSGIVTLTGDISFIPTPTSLNYTSNTSYTSTPSLVTPTPVIFAERIAFTVPDFHAINPLIPAGASIEYQISSPGTYGPALLTNTPLAIGSDVTTYLVHWDAGLSQHAAGSIVFDRPIFALQTIFNPDSAPEDLFSLPSINVGASSGLEIGDAFDSDIRDTLTLSADRMTLSFDFRMNGATEVMRIIFVPEPSAIALFASALVLVGGFVRRARRHLTRAVI